MEDTNNILDLADALAGFSNLEPADAEDFRKRHAGFLPDIWWTMPAFFSETDKRPLVWQLHQQTLQEAWQARFPLDKCVKLIGAGTFPYKAIQDLTAKQNIVAPELANAEFAKTTVVIPSTDPRYAEVLALATTTLEMDPAGLAKYEAVYPYMQAVMLLATESWRARFCPFCGNRFAADIPARRFCSDKCFQESRRRYGNAMWAKHGKEWRSSKKKSSTKRTKKGSK